MRCMRIRAVQPSDSSTCGELGACLFGQEIGEKVRMAVADLGVGIGQLGQPRCRAVHAAYWVAQDPETADLLGMVGLYSPRVFDAMTSRSMIRSYIQ